MRTDPAPRPALALLTFAAFFVACAPHVPYQVSSADQKRFVTVVRVPASAPSAAPAIFGLDDCTVSMANTAHEDIVGWRTVLRSDWGGSYPKFMTVCTRESMHWDGKYVQIFLCAQAIGAGGGCADGGDYRLRNSPHGWQWSSGNGAWDNVVKES